MSETINNPVVTPSMLTVTRRTNAIVHHVTDANPTYPEPIPTMLKLYFKRLYTMTRTESGELRNPGACVFVNPQPDYDPVYCVGQINEGEQINCFERIIAESARMPERRGISQSAHSLLIAAAIPSFRDIVLLGIAGVKEIVFHAEYLFAITELQQAAALNSFDRLAAKGIGIAVLYDKVDAVGKINGKLYAV